MNYQKILVITNIILIGVIIWFLIKPYSNTNNNSYYNDSTYVSYDTTLYNTHYNIVKPNIIIQTDTSIIDTSLIKELINDYFATIYYLDTLKNDTSATIVLQERVTKNRVLNRDLIFKNNRPTHITNIDVTNDYGNNIFLLGSLQSFNTGLRYGVGGGYKYKHHALGLSVYTDKTISLNYQYFFFKDKSKK